MASFLVLLGLGGLLFGLINLVRPSGRLGMATRKRAGSLLGVSLGVFVAAAAFSPSDTAASDTGVVAVGSSTTTSSSVAMTTSTTLEATTTSTISLPPIPRAEIIFAAPAAGISGDPGQSMDPSAEIVTLTSIRDGDTVEVMIAAGTRETVRLIGVNTPESGECWSEEAALVLETLIPIGSEIGMTSDTSDRDQFDRLLRYIWIGTMSVNQEIVQRGAAISRRYSPDTALAERFEAAQASARSMDLGLWASEACGPASDSDLRIVDLVADAAGDDNQNLNGESVKVRNMGDNVAELTGWGIKDESASHRFNFPVGFSLAPGEVVTIYSGCGDEFGAELFWCAVGSAIWNNDGNTAFLTDLSGNTHATRAYAPPTTTTSSTTTSTTTTVATTTTTASASEQCHPSYQGDCVPVGVSDVDCAGGSGNGPYYVGRVTVVGHDEYGLDRDGDGVACE
jgi:micrococcal nuclease